MLFWILIDFLTVVDIPEMYIIIFKATWVLSYRERRSVGDDYLTIFWQN